MGKDYIHLLIRKFFENELSPEIQQKFRRWLLSSGGISEKEQALSALWENTPATADETTFRELKQLHKRIAPQSIPRIFSLYQYLRRIAVLLLLPLLSVLGTYYYMTSISPVIAEPEMVECFVPYGERKQIILSDGSEVWVNAGSLLVYEKEFKGKTRTLFLSGEANFNVTKNPEKPFLVKTKYMNVEALGTAFNVQSYPDSPNTTATLEEGKIKVDTKCTESQPIILLPNEQVVYNHISKQIIRRKINATGNSRWKQGYLIFQGASFGEIVQVVERNFGVTINYEVGRYKERTFTIKFSPDEKLEQVLDILQKMIGFRYKVEKNVVFINN